MYFDLFDHYFIINIFHLLFSSLKPIVGIIAANAAGHPESKEADAMRAQLEQSYAQVIAAILSSI